MARPQGQSGLPDPRLIDGRPASVNCEMVAQSTTTLYARHERLDVLFSDQQCGAGIASSRRDLEGIGVPFAVWVVMHEKPIRYFISHSCPVLLS
jgi:hypothetical protein